jgi:hypothetical protein
MGGLPKYNWEKQNTGNIGIHWSAGLPAGIEAGRPAGTASGTQALIRQIWTVSSCAYPPPLDEAVPGTLCSAARPTPIDIGRSF